jgi:hypothetical protein
MLLHRKYRFKPLDRLMNMTVKITGIIIMIFACVGSVPGVIGVIFCEINAVIPIMIGST